MNDIDTNNAARSAAGASAAFGDTILVRVFTVLEQVRPGQPLSDGARLADSGFTSLDMVRIMLDIEAEFDLMIPQGDINPENFLSAASIAALMRRLSSD